MRWHRTQVPRTFTEYVSSYVSNCNSKLGAVRRVRIVALHGALSAYEAYLCETMR